MNKFVKIIKGYLISIIIFFLLTILTSILLKFTGLPEKFAAIYIVIAIALTCIFIGMYAGHLFGKRGLIVGAAFSVILVGIIITINLLCFMETFSFEMLSFQYLIPVVCGSFGGIIGTNLKN